MWRKLISCAMTTFPMMAFCAQQSSIFAHGSYQVEVISASQEILAGESDEVPRLMRRVGFSYKWLTISASDSANNAQSRELAQRLADLLRMAWPRPPEGLTSFEIQDFRNLIESEIDIAESLVSAFSRGDNLRALVILRQRSDLHGHGYHQF